MPRHHARHNTRQKWQKTAIYGTFSDVLRGKIGGPSRNRTGVHGFAVRYVTTPPSGHPCGEALPLDEVEALGNSDSCKFMIAVSEQH